MGYTDTGGEQGGIFGVVEIFVWVAEEQARGARALHGVGQGMPKTLKDLMSILKVDYGKAKLEEYISRCELRSALIPMKEVCCSKSSCEGATLEAVAPPNELLGMKKVDSWTSLPMSVKNFNL
jgi:hypothetical protein